jgi:hypothetical protein
MSGPLYRKLPNGRYREVTEEELAESGRIRFIDGGIRITHWGIRVLACSLADSLGDSNFLKVDVKPALGEWLTVVLSKRGKLEPPKIKEK